MNSKLRGFKELCMSCMGLLYIRELLFIMDIIIALLGRVICGLNVRIDRLGGLRGNMLKGSRLIYCFTKGNDQNSMHLLSHQILLA